MTSAPRFRGRDRLGADRQRIDRKPHPARPDQPLAGGRRWSSQPRRQARLLHELAVWRVGRAVLPGRRRCLDGQARRRRERRHQLRPAVLPRRRCVPRPPCAPGQARRRRCLERFVLLLLLTACCWRITCRWLSSHSPPDGGACCSSASRACGYSTECCRFRSSCSAAASIRWPMLPATSIT